MALFRFQIVLCVVLITILIKLTAASTGKQNPSPIVLPKIGQKVTSITLRHGQTHKADCRQSDAPTAATTRSTNNRKSPPSRHRRDQPSEEDSEYTVDADAPAGVEFHQVKPNQNYQTVHLFSAKYMPAAKAKKPCGTLDVVDRMREGCDDMAHDECVFVARDPSTVSGCQRRSLQLKYYCAKAESVSLMVNMMIDDV